MATTKKPTTKKVVVKKVSTDEDRILGNEIKDEVKEVTDYLNENVKYQVTNLKLDNGANIFYGKIIETFIGKNNEKARLELINGAKTVITKDGNGKDAYKIEVV